MTNYVRMWSVMDQHRFEIDRGLADDVTCVICSNLLVDAHQGPCGCNYCRRCIEGLIEAGGSRCPGGDRDCLSEDLTLCDKVTKDHSANRRVSKLIVECVSDGCDNRTNLYHLECCKNNCKDKRIFSSKEKNKVTKERRRSNGSDKSDTIRKIEEGIRINKKVKTIIREAFEELERLKLFQKYIVNGLSNQDIEISLTALQIENERSELEMVEGVPSGQEVMTSSDAGSSLENKTLIEKLRREVMYLRKKRDEQDKEKIILISKNRMLSDEMAPVERDTKDDNLAITSFEDGSTEGNKELMEKKNMIDRVVVNLRKERDQQDKEKIILISQKKMLEEELELLKNRINSYNIGENCNGMDQGQECMEYKYDSDQLRTALNDVNKKRDKEKIVLLSQNKLLKEELNELRKGISANNKGCRDAHQKFKEGESSAHRCEVSKLKRALFDLRKKRDKQDKEKIILLSQKRMLEEELSQLKNNMEHHDLGNSCSEGANEEIEKIKRALIRLKNERDAQDKEKLVLISQKKMLEERLGSLTRDEASICPRDTDREFLNNNGSLQDVEHTESEDEKNGKRKLKEALRNTRVKSDERDKEKILLMSQKKLLEEELEMLKNNMKQNVKESACTRNTKLDDHQGQSEMERIKKELRKLEKERDEEDEEKVVLIRQKRMLEVKLQETENAKKDVLICDVMNVESAGNNNESCINMEQRNEKRESSKYHCERSKLKRALIDLRKKRDKQDKEKIILISQKRMLEEELSQLKNSMEHPDLGRICTEGTNEEIEKIKKALIRLKKERDAQDKEKLVLISQKKMLEEEWRMYKDGEKDAINCSISSPKTSGSYVALKDELKESDPEDIMCMERESKSVLYMQPVIPDLHTDVSGEYFRGEHSPPVGLIKSFATLKTKVIDVKLKRDNHGWIRSENLNSVNDNYQMWILSNFGGCTDHFGSHFCFGFNMKAIENSADRAWPFTCLIDITIGDDRKKKRSLKLTKHIRFDKSNYQLFHPGELFHFSYHDIDLLELIQQNAIVLECNVDKIS